MLLEASPLQQAGASHWPPAPLTGSRVPRVTPSQSHASHAPRPVPLTRCPVCPVRPVRVTVRARCEAGRGEHHNLTETLANTVKELVAVKRARRTRAYTGTVSARLQKLTKALDEALDTHTHSLACRS
jgi:hypothetical protein